MGSQDTEQRSPVVVAYSPKTEAREPVEFGIAASMITGAPLIIAAVRHGDTLVQGAVGDTKTGGARADALHHLEQDLDRRGVGDVELRVFQDHTPARGLARAIDELKPALIVVGSTHRGATGSALLGSTAERVIHASACPVAVVPNGYARPPAGVQMIGAAFADTEEGRGALSAAAALARLRGARVRAILVLDPKYVEAQAHGLMAQQHHEVAPEVGEAAADRLGAEATLRAAVAELGADVDLDVLVNDPVDGLVAASRSLDLLVMGSRGLGPKRAVVLGSVSRKVVDRAACPVLVLPRGTSEMAAQLLAGAAEQTPPSA